MNSRKSKKKRLLALLLCLLMVTTLIQGNGYSAFAELVQGGSASEGSVATGTDAAISEDMAVVDTGAATISEDETGELEENYVSMDNESEDLIAPVASELEVVAVDEAASEEGNFMDLVNEVDITPSSNVKITDDLNITLYYALPEIINGVDPLKSMYIYSFKLTDIIVTDESGTELEDFINAYETSGSQTLPVVMGTTRVGSYTIKDGIVTLNYYEGLDDLEDSATLRVGEFTFTCSLDAEQVNDKGGSYKIKFATTPAATEKEITVQPKDYATPGVTVEKTGGELNDDGTVKYTIEVKNIGTTAANDISVKDEMGTYLSMSGTPTCSGGSSFSSSTSDKTTTFNIGSLGAGETATIAYTCSVSEGAYFYANNANGSTNYGTDNRITAMVDGQDIYLDNTSKESQTVSTVVKKDMVGKSVSTNSDTGEMTWTITINSGAAKFNLNGTTIQDVLGTEGNGQALDGNVSVSVSNADKNSTAVANALKNYFTEAASGNGGSGYTISADTTATYTVTYTTKANAYSSQTKYSNMVSAKKDNYSDTEKKESNYIGTRLATKTFNGTLNSNGFADTQYIITEDMAKDDTSLTNYVGSVILPWKTEINVPADASSFKYEDTIYSWENENNFYPSNESADFSVTVNGVALVKGTDYTVTDTSESWGKGSETISLTDSGLAKAKGGTVVITYQTVGKYDELNDGQNWYKNHYTLKIDNIEESDTAYVVVEKKDEEEEEEPTEDPAITKKAVAYDAKNHTITWCIEVDASKDAPISEVTLTDVMTDMRYNGYTYGNSSYRAYTWEDGDTKDQKVIVYDEKWVAYYPTITEKKLNDSSENPSYEYTIKITPDILNTTIDTWSTSSFKDKDVIDQKLLIYYTTGVVGDNLYSNNTSTYKNTVTGKITYEGDPDPVVETADASQDLTTSVLSKTVGDVDGIATLKYTLDVNPDALKLNPDSSQHFYQIEDSLPSTLVYLTAEKYTTVKDSAGVTYKRVSDISEVTSAAAGAEIYHVSYENDTLVFTVPDEAALNITYNVTMLYDDKSAYATFTNSAKFRQPYVSEESLTSNSAKKRIATSSATITSSFLEVKKVDSDNTTQLLEGATITATEKYWDGSQWKDTGYVFTATSRKDRALTDDDFKASATTIAAGQEMSTPKIRTDHIYEIVETSAPTGYELTSKTYSVIYLSDGTTIKKSTLPDGTLSILPGSQLVFADKKLVIEESNKLTITKNYYQADGTTLVEDKPSGDEAAVIEIYDAEYTFDECESGIATPLSMGDQGNGFTYTNDNNVITLTGIPQGTYTVYEKKAAEGYDKLNRVYHFTVSADKKITWDTDTTSALELSETLKNSQTIENNFVINKTYKDAAGNDITNDVAVSDGENNTLPKAVFTCKQTQRYVDGKYQVIEPNSQKTTELAAKDGKTYTLENLSPGVYEIAEKESSVYETLDNLPITLTVDANGNITATDANKNAINSKASTDVSYNVTNTVKANQITVSKAYYMLASDNKTLELKDSKDVDSKDKATFTLYKSSDGSKYEQKVAEIVPSKSSYESGKDKYIFKNLVPGKYMIEETVGADSVTYDQLQKVYFTVNADYTITTAASKNPSYTKTVDVNNNEQRGESARFYLQKYVSDYQGDTTKVSDSDKYEFSIKAEGGNNLLVNNSLEYKTDTGRWEIYNLPEGTYVISETKCPDYMQKAKDITIKVENSSRDDICKITSVMYDENEYINTTQITKDGILWTGTVIDEDGVETLVANLVNKPVENSISITKSYMQPDGTTSYTGITKENAASFTLYNAATEKSYGEEVVTVSGNTTVHTYKNLNPGKYYIEETSPEGFDTCDKIEITVNSDYTITVTKPTNSSTVDIKVNKNLNAVLSATNTLTNEFSFTKSFTLVGGTTATAEQAAKLCGQAAFILTDKDGKEVTTAKITRKDNVYTVKDLNDGIYYIVEKTAPDGFSKAGNITLNVELGKITVSYAGSASDFTGLKGNSTSKVSATLHNRAKGNSLTINKTYYDVDGNKLTYNTLGGSTASFTLKNASGTVVAVSSTNVYKGEYVYKNLAPGQYTLSENAVTGFAKLEDTVSITVDENGKISYTVAEKLTMPRWKNGTSDVSDATIGIDNQRYGNGFTINKAYYDVTGAEISMPEAALKVSFKLRNKATGDEISMTRNDDKYTVTNLDAGVYEVIETIPEENGCKQADGTITVTVSSDRTITSSYDGTASDFSSKSTDSGRTETVTFKNHQVSNSLTIEKSYEEADGTAIDIDELETEEVAKFDIYKAGGKTPMMECVYANGTYQFTDIPDGEYEIRETAGEGFKKADDISITVKESTITVTKGTVKTGSSDSSNNVVLTVKNVREQLENSITINKEYYNQGAEQISVADDLLKATVFTMYDANNKAVSGFKYDAELKNWKAENLKAGTYTIKETTAPDGYVAAKDLTVTVKKDGTINVVYEGESTDFDVKENNVADVSVTLRNHEKVSNTLEVDKYFVNAFGETVTDKTLIDTYIKDTAFTLSYATGDKAEITGETDGNKFIWKDLQMGTYELVESNSADGFVKAAKIDVSVGADGTITVNYSGDEGTVTSTGSTNKVINVYNRDSSTSLSISKTDINGSEELENAQIRIYKDGDSDNQIDSWTSSTAPHMISKGKFEANVIYVLEETVAPFGYEITDSIRFTIDETGNVFIVKDDGTKESRENSYIKMTDNYSYLKVAKVDSAAKALAGATLQITDEIGNVVEEAWTSTSNEPHQVQIGGKLKANTVYVLSEVSAPYGYKKAADIKFMLDDSENIKVYNPTLDKYVDYDNEVLTMADMTQKLYFSKTDITNGSELPGAVIKITDANGNEIDSWKSTETKHAIDIIGFTPGEEYSFTEITAPNGYDVAETIVFKLNSNGKVFIKDAESQFNALDSDTIVMQDKPSGVTVTTGRLIITKTIKGDVTKEEAEGALQFKVTDAAGNSKTYTLKDFVYDKATNKYTYTLEDVVGGYTVEEVVTDIKGYTLKSVSYTVGDVTTSGKKAEVSVEAGKDTVVEYQDTYEKTTVATTQTSTEATTQTVTTTAAPTTESAVVTEVTTTETLVVTPTTETETSSSQVKTGDSTPVKVVAVLMMVSVLSLMGLGIYRKLMKKDEEN